MPLPNRRSAHCQTSSTIWVLGLLFVFTLTLQACSGLIDLKTDHLLPSSEAVNADLSDNFSAYFSDPENPVSSSYRGGPDEALADAIRDARVSVDMAIHFLDLWSIRDALIDAHRRGVTVRLVTESDYMDVPEIQELRAAGIPVLGDRREGRMHNKFVVIDRQEVWTGSLNLSVNGAYSYDNNLVRVRSSSLAEDFTTEFEEMFVEDRFGPGSPADTPYPSLLVEDTRVEVYFSPDDGVADHLLSLVRAARESIYFMAFAFTADDLSEAMIQRSQTGVDVAGVFDRGQSRSNVGTEYDKMRAAGLDVRLDGNTGKMHHKVIIIDESILITGSYNFSRNAETQNDENVLVIHSPEIAARFLNEFERVYGKAGK